MSKLDKQLAIASGAQPIEVRWTEETDVSELRRQLIQAIDKHTDWVPLDLRSVHGAPPELVELLVDMRRYAISKSKKLSLTWILPPLRDAYEKRMHQPVGTSVAPSSDPDQEQASELAKDLLNGVEKKPEYDLSKAEKIERKRKLKSKSKGDPLPPPVRYLLMSGFVILSVCAIGVVHYFFFTETNEIIFDDQIKVSFEEGTGD